MRSDASTDLENEIAIAAMRIQFARSRRDRAKAFEDLKRLHRLRSAERIKEMEKEQGLR